MSAEPHLTDQDYELLSAYMDGDLSEAEQAMVEQRLKTDSLFQRELTALRQTVALINQLPTLKAPRNYTLDANMVEARTESRPAANVIQFAEKRPRRISYGMLSAVAAVVVVIFGGVLLMSMSNQNNQSTASQIMDVAANPTQVETAALEQQRAPKTATQEDEVFYATVEDGVGANENAAGAAPDANPQTLMVPETVDAPESTGAGADSDAPAEEPRTDDTDTASEPPQDALDMAAATEPESDADEAQGDAVFSTLADADDGTANQEMAETFGTVETEDMVEDAAVEPVMVPPPSPTQASRSMDPATESAAGEADSNNEVMNAFLAPSGRLRVQVFVIEHRPFKLADDGLTWIDVTYIPDEMPLTEVIFASTDYSTLLMDHPELATYAEKLGERFIVVFDQTAYFIHPPEGTSTP